MGEWGGWSGSMDHGRPPPGGSTDAILGVDSRGAHAPLLRGFAHELRNLLGVFINGGELLQDELEMAPGQTEVAATLDDMQRAGERARVLVGRLTALAALDGMELVPLDVAGVIGTMAPRLERAAAHRHLSVSIAVSLSGDGPPVGGDPAVLTDLVVDLVENASRATRDGGRITVDVAPQERAPGAPETTGPWVRVRVTDDGHGMEPMAAARAFEPFFTTSRGRWGVGLCMVQAAAAAMGGHVTLQTRRGEGTTVSVWLPEVAPERPLFTGPISVYSGEHTGPTALVVDDDPARCTVMKRILEGIGLRVLAASHPEVGLLLFGQQDEGVALVVVPEALPGIPPADLVADLRVRQSGLRVLHMRDTEGGEPPPWADAEIPRAVDAGRVQAAVAALLPGLTSH
jgi:CheY-like chemotaxis protein